MRIVPFKQVDVFTSRPFCGNPVAVVFGADGLDEAQMQGLAAWTNLSETTFVMAPTVPGADYRLRIFTPRQELPFAGHPSVGTAHAALEAGWAHATDDRLVQECAAGLLSIRIEREAGRVRLFVRVPEAHAESGDMMLTHALGRALGIPLRSNPEPRPIDVGPTWIIADLEEAAIVNALEPDMAALANLCRERDAVGVTVFGRSMQDGVALEARSFAPADGIPEGPGVRQRQRRGRRVPLSERDAAPGRVRLRRGAGLARRPRRPRARDGRRGRLDRDRRRGRHLRGRDHPALSGRGRGRALALNRAPSTSPSAALPQ
jgi:PhzF family phenazine biosynthesis protein